MFMHGFVRALLVCLWCTSHAQSAADTCYYHSQTLPVPMYAHFAAYNPTKNAVYLFGGFTGRDKNSKEDVTSVYKWDLNAPDSPFTEIGSIPSSASVLYSWIANGNAVFVDNKVYFIGAPDAPDGLTWSGKIYVYDTETEQWLNTDDLASPPENLVYGCLANTATHIFMVDGEDRTSNGGPNPRTPHVYIYSIADNSWTSHVIDSEMMTNGGWLLQYCSLIEDELHVMGGWAGIDALSVIYRMNIQTLQIEKLSVALPAGQADGVAIADQTVIYLVGSTAYTQEIVAFDVLFESVSTAFTTQETFASAAVLKINGKIYRFGGRVDSYTGKDTVEICDLPTNSPTIPPSQHPSSNPATTASPTSVTPTTAMPSSSPTAPNEPTTVTTFEPTTQSPTLNTLSTTVSRNTTVIVTIRTDSLSSTEILVAIANAYNLSLSLLTVTELSSSDDDDGFATVTVELLVAVASNTQLEFDVIEATLREAMVDEYGDDIEVEITEGDAPTQEQPEHPLQWLVPVAYCIVSVCGCFSVFGIVKCILAKRHGHDEHDQLQAAQIELPERRQPPAAVLNNVHSESESEVEEKNEDINPGAGGEPDMVMEDSVSRGDQGRRASVVHAAQPTTRMDGMAEDEFEVLDDDQDAMNSDQAHGTAGHTRNE